MKTRLFFSLATAAMLFANTITANNIENMYDLGGTRLKISAVNTEKAVIVDATNTFNQEITVNIEDINGNTLYSEKIKEGQRFVKKYNLTKLESGDYRLVVVKKLFKTIQPITVTEKTVEMSEVERKEKFLPNVTAKNGLMDVNVLLGNYNNIHVRLYDVAGKKVFEELNYVVFNLHKRYDLTKLDKGIYFAEVVAGDEVQTFTIKL
jgi:hypothetical protein